jgi:hypothetical protein
MTVLALLAITAITVAVSPEATRLVLRIFPLFATCLRIPNEGIGFIICKGD